MENERPKIVRILIRKQPELVVAMTLVDALALRDHLEEMFPIGQKTFEYTPDFNSASDWRGDSPFLHSLGTEDISTR